MMKIKNPTFTKRYLYREKLKKKTNPIHVSYKILKKNDYGGDLIHFLDASKHSLHLTNLIQMLCRFLKKGTVFMFKQ